MRIATLLAVAVGVAATNEDDLKTLNKALNLSGSNEVKKTIEVRLTAMPGSKKMSVESQWTALGVPDASALSTRWATVENLPPVAKALELARKFRLTPYLSAEDTAKYVLAGENAETSTNTPEMTVYFHGVSGEAGRDKKLKALGDATPCGPSDRWRLKIVQVEGESRHRQRRNAYDDGLSDSDSDDSVSEEVDRKKGRKKGSRGRDQFAAKPSEGYFTHEKSILRMDPDGKPPVLIMPAAPYQITNRQFKYVCKAGSSASSDIDLKDVLKYFGLKGDGFSDLSRASTGAGPTPWIAQGKAVPCGTPQQFLHIFAQYLVAMGETINKKMVTGSKEEEKRIGKVRNNRIKMRSWEQDFIVAVERYHYKAANDNSYSRDAGELEFKAAIQIAKELYPIVDEEVKNVNSSERRKQILDQIAEMMRHQALDLERQFEELTGQANLENLALKWSYAEGRFSATTAAVHHATKHFGEHVLQTPHAEVLKIARGVSKSLVECGLVKFFEPFIVGLDAWALWAYRQTTPAGISASVPQDEEEVTIPEEVVRELARALVRSGVTEDQSRELQVGIIHNWQQGSPVALIDRCADSALACGKVDEDRFDECRADKLTDVAEQIRIYLSDSQGYQALGIATPITGVINLANQYKKAATTARKSQELHETAVQKRADKEEVIRQKNLGLVYNKRVEMNEIDKAFPALAQAEIKKLKANEDLMMGKCKSVYVNFRNELQKLKLMGDAIQANDGALKAGAADAFERALEPLSRNRYEGEHVNVSKFLRHLMEVIPTVRRSDFGKIDNWTPTGELEDLLMNRMKPTLEKYGLKIKKN